jgi:hypothetical protein
MMRSLFILISMVSFESLCQHAVTFHKTKDTLNTIQRIITSQEKGAYLRFGDGDINLALGKHELLQNANKQLMNEMREAFSLNGPSILKCLPLHCKEFGGYEEGMFPGNHEAPYDWCLTAYHNALRIWGAPITGVYSHTALSFAALEYIDDCISFLKFLKSQNCVLLIGNKNIPLHIKNILFGSQCDFIPTPEKHAYSTINQTEQACLIRLNKDHKYKVVIISMGCSGRALAKRLYHKVDNIFLFDFGSLMDILCGWNTRAWITLTKEKITPNIEKILDALQSQS